MDQSPAQPQFDDTMKPEGILKWLNTFLDLIKQYKDIIYKTSAKEIGKTAHLAEKKQDFGHNGKFSKVMIVMN